MTFCESREKLGDNTDPEMVRILEEMLGADVTITARAVARKHSLIGHASSITRHEVRSSLLKDFQEKQRQYRQWRTRGPKRSRENLAALLAQRDHKIADLERQVSALRVSHLAMIRTVGEIGGMSKLLKLYSTYSDVRKELEAIEAMPKGHVHEFPAR